MVSQTMSDQLEEESRRMDERLQILRKMMSVEKARREYVCSMCLQNLALSTIHCGHRKQKWRMHGYGLNSRGGHSLASYPGSAHQEPGYKASHSQALSTIQFQVDCLQHVKTLSNTGNWSDLGTRLQLVFTLIYF